MDIKQPRLCFTSNHLDKLQTTNLTQFAIYDMAYDLRHRVIIQFSTRRCRHIQHVMEISKKLER